MHSSEKQYYCKECDEQFRGPSFFKHLKSDKHYGNYVKHHFESSPLGEPDCDDTQLGTISMGTPTPPSREHEANFMRSLSQFLDMWYPSPVVTTTSTPTHIGISISISKVDNK